MGTIKMSQDINHDRRRFLGTAAMTVAAAQLGMIGSADAQSGTTIPADATSITLGTIKPGTNTSFGSLKQIDAGVLNIGYAEAGPAEGPAVILLHGWPYDIHSFVDVAPALASAGYRVIVPHWGAAPGQRLLCQEILGQICAPDHQRRRRAQSAARGSAGLCRSDRRGRRLVQIEQVRRTRSG